MVKLKTIYQNTIEIVEHLNKDWVKEEKKIVKPGTGILGFPTSSSSKNNQSITLNTLIIIILEFCFINF